MNRKTDGSIFTDKTKAPEPANLAVALGQKDKLWQEVYDLVCARYPSALSEWKWPGAKHRRNFRIKDRKRVIIYLLPRDRRFMVAFVFDPKAYEAVISSNVAAEIKWTCNRPPLMQKAVASA